MRGVRQAKQGRTWARLGGRACCCLAAVLAIGCLWAPPAGAAFGIASLSTAATDEDGSPDFQAGSHPFAYSIDFAMNTDSEGLPEGGLRSIEVELPAGLVGDPGAVPACSRAEFDGVPKCSFSSQVGVVEADVSGLGAVRLALYNLVPPPGYVASFGGSAEGNSFIELLSIQGSGPEARLGVTVPLLPLGNQIVRVSQTLWGVPADPGHNAERGECLSQGGSCPPVTGPAALLTLPARCGGSPTTTVTVSSLEAPGQSLSATAGLLDQGNAPRGLLGCDALSFAPSLAVGADGAALSPSGLRLDLSLPPSDQPEGRAAAALRELTLGLPPGLVIDPSAGSDLEGCSPGQIGLRSEPGAPPSFDAVAPTCPGASEIGTISADLPPLGEALSGPVYLATPGRNPYATTFAMYMVLEDPARGVVIKVPARLDADPATGRLTAAITDLPEFPFTGVSIRFPSGPGALFAAPPVCGAYATTAALVPSTAPEGPVAHVRGEFSLRSGPGGACPAAEAARPASSSFDAGSVLPAAGASSAFVLALTRTDLDQHFGALDVTLPPGLLADLGSTPVGAPVGSVRVEAGLDPRPLELAGTAYLGGAYDGAPYSLEFVVPGRVGPFDLGTIVVRAALEVDPQTAQVKVRSDPLPRILSGVPLELRSFAVDLDRPGFIRNPTSCEPMAIAGAATTGLGQVTPLSVRFQMVGCGLPLEPRLSLRLLGAPGRGGHPGVRAVVREGEGEATPASVAFTLPAGELLDLRRIRGLCPRRVAVEWCPRSSRLGSVRLWSPFLPEPLAGTLYLRVPSHRLPGLAASLRSPSGSFRFVLHGRATLAKGRLGVALQSLPDIPLSRAVLTLAGGRRGILVNSHSLCRGLGPVTASLAAHNGSHRRLRVRPRRPADCPAARKRKRHS